MVIACVISMVGTGKYITKNFVNFLNKFVSDNVIKMDMFRTSKRFIIIFLIVFLETCSNSEFSEDDILLKFQKDGCLKGNVEIQAGNLVFMDNSNLDMGQTVLLNFVDEDFKSFSEEKNLLKTKSVLDESIKNFQKSPSMLLNELAMYNGIESTYNLISEHGPAHQKIFTIKLKLGNEEYEGIGNSLKSAKRSAAAKALKNTKYEQVPFKNIENQLYELANARNEKVVFFNEYGKLIADSKEFESPIFFPSDKNMNNFSNEINKSEEIDFKNSHVSQDDPFIVRLHVGTREYLGLGYTQKSARHDAAVKALEELKKIDLEEYCLQENDCDVVSNSLKSPVSLLYETAQKIDKSIVFSLIKEEGPQHAKTFTFRCQVSELVTEAEARSKKASKKLAAELMLEKFRKLGWLKEAATSHRKKRNNNNKIRKNTVNRENVEISEEIPKVIFEKEPTLIQESENLKAKLSKKNSKSIKDKLTEIANVLGASIQYWDIPKNNHEKFITFVSLGLSPPQVCFGIDSVLETARDLASLRALEMLEDYGVDNIFSKHFEKEGNNQNDDHLSADYEVKDLYSSNSKLK